MIKFVANENIGHEIVRYLEKQGFRVYSILKELKGLTDEEITRKAFREKAIIITSDKDFGELFYYVLKLKLLVIKFRR